MSIRKREHAHEARCHLPVLLPLGEGSWLAFARCKTPYETIIMSACACMPITNCRTHKSASLHGPAIKSMEDLVFLVRLNFSASTPSQTQALAWNDPYQALGWQIELVGRSPF